MLPQLTAIFGRIAVLVDRVGKPDEGADFLSVLQQFDRASAPSADQSASAFFGVAEAGPSPEEGEVEPMVTVKDAPDSDDFSPFEEEESDSLPEPPDLNPLPAQTEVSAAHPVQQEEPEKSSRDALPLADVPHGLPAEELDAEDGGEPERQLVSREAVPGRLGPGSVKGEQEGAQSRQDKRSLLPLARSFSESKTSTKVQFGVVAPQLLPLQSKSRAVDSPLFVAAGFPGQPHATSKVMQPGAVPQLPGHSTGHGQPDGPHIGSERPEVRPELQALQALPARTAPTKEVPAQAGKQASTLPYALSPRDVPKEALRKPQVSEPLDPATDRAAPQLAPSRLQPIDLPNTRTLAAPLQALTEVARDDGEAVVPKMRREPTRASDPGPADQVTLHTSSPSSVGAEEAPQLRKVPPADAPMGRVHPHRPPLDVLVRTTPDLVLAQNFVPELETPLQPKPAPEPVQNLLPQGAPTHASLRNSFGLLAPEAKSASSAMVPSIKVSEGALGSNFSSDSENNLNHKVGEMPSLNLLGKNTHQDSHSGVTQLEAEREKGRFPIRLPEFSGPERRIPTKGRSATGSMPTAVAKSPNLEMSERSAYQTRPVAATVLSSNTGPRELGLKLEISPTSRPVVNKVNVVFKQDQAEISKSDVGGTVAVRSEKSSALKAPPSFGESRAILVVSTPTALVPSGGEGQSLGAQEISVAPRFPSPSGASAVPAEPPLEELPLSDVVRQVAGSKAASPTSPQDFPSVARSAGRVSPPAISVSVLAGDRGIIGDAAILPEISRLPPVEGHAVLASSLKASFPPPTPDAQRSDNMVSPRAQRSTVTSVPTRSVTGEPVPVAQTLSAERAQSASDVTMPPMPKAPFSSVVSGVATEKTASFELTITNPDLRSVVETESPAARSPQRPSVDASGAAVPFQANHPLPDTEGRHVTGNKARPASSPVLPSAATPLVPAESWPSFEVDAAPRRSETPVLPAAVRPEFAPAMAPKSDSATAEFLELPEGGSQKKGIPVSTQTHQRDSGFPIRADAKILTPDPASQAEAVTIRPPAPTTGHLRAASPVPAELLKTGAKSQPLDERGEGAGEMLPRSSDEEASAPVPLARSHFKVASVDEVQVRGGPPLQSRASVDQPPAEIRGRPNAWVAVQQPSPETGRTTEEALPVRIDETALGQGPSATERMPTKASAFPRTVHKNPSLNIPSKDVAFRGVSQQEAPLSRQRGASVLAPRIEEPEDPKIDPLPAVAEPRAPQATSGLQLRAHRHETAMQVIRQIGEAIVDRGGDVVELRLEPEELGHVRFRMTGGEHALSMTILADRPETLDLLRRHVDQLARHLDDLGYSATQFRFGEGSGQGGAFRGSFAGGDGPEDLDTIPQNDTSEPSSGLDIRV